MTASDATTRFSNRVRDYVRFRPGYPADVVHCLTAEFGLLPTQTVADIGSGTGISARLFLANGNPVLGVEPNADMRAAADRMLQEFKTFRSIAGTAEATTLADGSVDWVLAAQAFHWFDVDRCRPEFNRILRPAGRVVLLWNDWQRESPFLQAYEALVRRHAVDYDSVCHNRAQTDGRIERCFAPSQPAQRTFSNHQDLDYAGLQGRLLSSSYMPPADTPQAEPMLAELKQIFAQHATHGLVRFDYVTRLYVGPPKT